MMPSHIYQEYKSTVFRRANTTPFKLSMKDRCFWQSLWFDYAKELLQTSTPRPYHYHKSADNKVTVEFYGLK